ncbi:MAG: signal recognition particle-docking protein FtsY [Bdellovibrionaceae bacterium]|nr:signal recognition particle-docking protein FtsY [Pseudobdellovibrionaceae bacterium]
MNELLNNPNSTTFWGLIGLSAALLVLGLLAYIRIKAKGKTSPPPPKALAPAAARPDFTEPRTPELVPVGKPAEPEPVAATPAPPPVEVPVETAKPLSDALSGTKSHFWGRVKGLFGAGAPLDLSDLEEVLYTSDLGPQTVERLLEEITPASKQGLESVKSKLREEFTKIFDEAQIPEPKDNPLAHLKSDVKPVVWMIVGVNGAGKTTSIGKIAAQLASQGKKVLVAAGDTFRAAAGAQLKVWTDRASGASVAGEGLVEIFHPEGITDPSAIAFDAVAKANGREFDVLLIDTAGRLHTQAHLMDELKKVKRVMTKVIPEAPHETLIVLDANNGQNALHQAREFNQALGLTGVILTKMDGTAKGGVAVGLSNELKIPIRLIGVGEKVQDLRAFSSREFIDSILNDA